MSKWRWYAAVAWLAVTTSGAWAQEVRTQNGLATVTFETPDGQVKVNYPQTLVAGDRFTGTVVAQPGGESEAERTASASRITGYVVEVNDSVKATAEGGRFQWQIPGSLSALTLVLRGPDGNVLSRTDAPVQSGLGATSAPAPEDFELPSLGQAGQPVRVDGPFDGDDASTRIAIGESPATVLAESPRAAFFEAPGDQLGLHPISVTENGATSEGQFRTIGFAHELPRTDLMKGEKTELKTTVYGLQGLERPVHLRLTNHTPQIISLPHGEMENITIEPGSENADGSYVFTTQIVGIRQGGFELSMNLLSDEAKDPCEELGDAIDSAVERAREKELESDALEDEAIELEDWAEKIEDHPPSRWQELADTYSKPRDGETESDRRSREETAADLERLVRKLDELNCGETMRERKRAAKRLRQEAEDLNAKRDRLRAEAEKLREEADRLREQHKECVEAKT
ncbi:MAG: hypothetical protein R3348_01255 [Xanthomonadales bacterium]|nr:hypothetical protein [Xanthomonadales bacterium]